MQAADWLQNSSFSENSLGILVVKEKKEPVGLAGQQHRLAVSWVALSKSEALIPFYIALGRNRSASCSRENFSRILKKNGFAMRAVRYWKRLHKMTWSWSNLPSFEVNPSLSNGLDYKTFWDPFQPKLCGVWKRTDAFPFLQEKDLVLASPSHNTNIYLDIQCWILSWNQANAKFKGLKYRDLWFILAKWHWNFNFILY